MSAFKGSFPSHHHHNQDLKELESMMEQFVLLDECSQPLFKKLISEQMMKVRRSDSYYLGSVSRPSTVTPITATAEILPIENSAVWSSVEEPIVDWGVGGANEWTTDEWGADANEWSAYEWTTDEWSSQVSSPNVGEEFVVEVEYNSALGNFLPPSKIMTTDFGRFMNRLREGKVKETFNVKFTKQIDPSKDSWAQIKVPGCYNIGIINFYMKDYLYYSQNTYVSSETEQDHLGIKAVTPHKFHPPVDKCKLSEGCSFRAITDISSHKDAMSKIKLRTDIINDWKMLESENYFESYAYFHNQDNRMILCYETDYLVGMIYDCCLDPNEGEKDVSVYLDGKSFGNEWRGDVYGYNSNDSNVCSIVGSFTFKKKIDLTPNQ